MRRPASAPVRTITVGDGTVGYLEAGGDGPLALCLHGFPDTPSTFRHLLPALADAGFHAVAPFLRGYGPTSTSPDGRYPLGLLVADAQALHAAFGGGPDAVLIGHDWGAEIAYGAAAHAPDRWRRLVALSVPPPALDDRLFADFEQLRRFFYLFLLASPDAVGIVARDDMAFLDALWELWSPGYDATHDLAAVKRALRSPERLAAAVAYYRDDAAGAAGDPHASEHAALARVPPQPTLYLHGEQDGCIRFELVRDVVAFLGAGSASAAVPRAGHFPQLEQPGAVNARILAWLTADTHPTRRP